MDLQEDFKGNFYIFGKAITSPYTADSVDTASCCIIVTECMRDLYFKVRMDMKFTIENSETVIDAQNSLYQKMIMKGFYKELQTLKSHYGIQKVMVIPNPYLVQTCVEKNFTKWPLWSANVYQGLLPLFISRNTP